MRLMTAFKYKIGQRVTVTWPTAAARWDVEAEQVVVEPTTYTQLGCITARTIENAVGKVYRVRSQAGRNLGHIPEEYLTPR